MKRPNPSSLTQAEFDDLVSQGAVVYTKGLFQLRGTSADDAAWERITNEGNPINGNSNVQ